MSKFLKIIVNLVVIAAIAVAAALLGPPFAGIDTVMNDNTETDTNLPVGSVAYGRTADTSGLKVGDRIIYSEGASDYIYEITDMDASAGVYKVSDPYNSNSEAQNITIQKSIPKVVLVVPFIGYGAIALQSTEGLIVVGLGIVFLIILFILSEIWRKDRDEEEEDEESEEDMQNEEEDDEDEEEDEVLSRRERRRLKKEEKRRRKMAKREAMEEDEDEEAWMAEYNLLTAKPVIFAANVSEDDLADDGASNAGVQAVREYAKREDCEVFVVCAEIEQEIAELDDDEKSMFLEELGLKESGLEKLIKASYSLLGLISYLTAGEPEVRAWTIKKGTKAPQAAGKIHTDFERGFIRAEVVSYDNLVEQGSENAAKEKGLVRSEGKDYVVQDGDVILFRFNV